MSWCSCSPNGSADCAGMLAACWPPERQSAKFGPVHTARLHSRAVRLPAGASKLLGLECAGMVTEVGKGVTKFKEGDRVSDSNWPSFRSVQAQMVSIRQHSARPCHAKADWPCDSWVHEHAKAESRQHSTYGMHANAALNTDKVA